MRKKERICNVCGVILTENNTLKYSTSRLCSTHFREYCREYIKTYTPKKNGENIKNMTEYLRIWRQENKDKMAKRQRNYRKNNQEKESCRQKTIRAVKNGKITKTACIICGDVNVEAHHDDYTNPLDVKWMCKKHHLEMHRAKL